MAKTLYEILGVAPSASLAQLQTAFNKIKRNLGKAGDKESMEALHMAREAYAILSNPDKRARYDQKLAQRAGLDTHDATEEDSAGLRTLPALTHDFPGTFQPCLTAMERWGNRPHDFNFMQKPSFLALLVLATAFLYGNFEAEKFHRLEQRLQANETATANAIAEKNQALKLRDEAQAQLDLARQQHESEAEARRAELENKRLDLENKRIDVEQSAVDANREVAIKQIDSGAAVANRNMDISLQTEAQRLQTEAPMRNARLRDLELAVREKQFTYDRKVQQEGIAIMVESALRDKYREQEINGEDRISRSNPALGRYIDFRPYSAR